jgi:predicted glycoside hydrolase/deacetylase ChbG (UPF0249 family)
VTEKLLVVNGDDFGASEGINRGIVEANVHGVLTSASLMVTGRAVDEAVALSRDHPALGVGLHWDVWGEDERAFDTRDLVAVREEFARQLERFRALMGRDPTHIDSHQHAHLEPHLRETFAQLVEPLGVPLRGVGDVAFVGGFYAQWEWRVTDLRHVSVVFLQQLLRDEIGPGRTELSCHPGYPSPGFDSVYLDERVEEVRTLTDPRVRETIEQLGIRLVSYADFPTMPRLTGSGRWSPSSSGSARRPAGAPPTSSGG